MTQAETQELIAALQPKHTADEPLARAMVSSDETERRDAINAYLVANNALKTAAASALEHLVAERDAAVAAAPKAGHVSVPLADYERLVLASEGDDMLVTCETCGAWLDRDDPAYCSADDFTGCWKMATGKGLCRHERGEILELAKLDRARNAGSGE